MDKQIEEIVLTTSDEINILDAVYDINYIDIDDDGKFHYMNKFAVQLVQARIAGLAGMMDYLLNPNWSSLWDRGWFQYDAVKEEYTAKIQEMYETAKNCFLELSHSLPMYDTYGK